MLTSERKISRRVFLAKAVAAAAALTLAGLGAECTATQTPKPVEPTKALAKIEDISPKEAYALIQRRKDDPSFVILDVRTPEERADGYIENSANLDFYSPSVREDLDKLDKGKAYLVYCHSGNRSRTTTEDIMKELGFREVYNMLGGISGWKEEELPTTK